MEYTEKIKYAKTAATQLLNSKSSTEIKEDLKSQGLYEYDISAIMASAKNIIIDELTPILKPILIEKRFSYDLPEFQSIDRSLIKQAAEITVNELVDDEHKKVAIMLREDATREEIINAVNLDLYPKSAIDEQISSFRKFKSENSGITRLFKILTGSALIVAGIIIVVASFIDGEVFFLPGFIILPGIGLLFSGLYKQYAPYKYKKSK